MDHEVVENYPHVSGVTKDLFFINHKNPETTNKSDGSHKNVYEIKYALKLAKYFLQQGYKNEQVTILCTYSDQSIAMQREQKNVHGEKNCVRIETVDNFQGEESDIIILSLVRSENYENKIGFLKISNRKCVALSRAKHGLYVIGNMNFIASAEKENNNYLKEWESWESIIETAKKSESISETFVVKCQMHGNIQNIQKPEDFDVKCAEGGCQLKCERELPCGHICEKFCHGDDMDHAKTICHQPCKKTCSSEFKHACLKECWEESFECGKCEVEVEKTLGCEHKVLIQCHIETETVKCIEPCDRHLPCEHKCPKICNEQCPTFCKVLINGLLNCGHRSQYECSADPLKIKCMQPEKKYWPLCKHTVDSFCYVNHEHELCPHPCEAILQDCGHKCEGTCGGCSQGLLHQLCQQECKKQLFCGHKCKAKCFEACPPCERYCRTECGHSYCSKANVKGKGKIRFLNSDTAKKDTNGRKCGEACPPCMEPCLIACEHLKCTMKCGEKCNIQLCTKPCGRPLPCSKKIKGKISILHPCLGVCGDKECLQTLCQICNEDAIKKIMKESPLNIMNEELSYVNGKINNAFVQLDNCKHIFEVTSLDNYIKTAIGYLDEGEKEIIKLKCPLCHKPIFTSHRYNCYINEQGTDFENIKLKLREYSTDKNKQQKFEREAAEIMLILSEISLCDPNCFIVLNNSFDISPLEVTPMWLIAAKNFKRILSNLAFYAAKIEECNFATLTDGCKRVLEECGIYDCHVYLKQKFNAVFDRCAYIPFANELFEQLSSETKRFGFLINLLLYLNKFSNEFDIDEDIDIDHDSLKEILMEIKSNEKFKDDHKAWDLFENLKDLYSVPSQPMTTTICILEKVPQQIKCYIISATLSTGSLITGIYVGKKRWQTVRVLPKALRLFLMFSCFPFFFAISFFSLYIAIFYLLYNTQSHYTVDFVRHIISFSANQIRSAFILIIFERITATLKLEKYTMSDKVTLFWRFTMFSYFTSFLYVAYNFYAKSMPDKSYLSTAVSYYVYSSHVFMFATSIVLYLMNRRMYKFSAYQITLKRRCVIAQIVKYLKYLFPTILIYSFCAQFGSMISIIFSSLNLPTLPLCSPHIFFNISFLFIYFRHFCIHLESVTTIKKITMIKNPLGKVIPIDAKADQYFNGLQHQWK